MSPSKFLYFFERSFWINKLHKELKFILVNNFRQFDYKLKGFGFERPNSIYVYMFVGYPRSILLSLITILVILLILSE